VGPPFQIPRNQSFARKLLRRRPNPVRSENAGFAPRLVIQ